MTGHYRTKYGHSVYRFYSVLKPGKEDLKLLLHSLPHPVNLTGPDTAGFADTGNVWRLIQSVLYG